VFASFKGLEHDRDMLVSIVGYGYGVDAFVGQHVFVGGEEPGFWIHLPNDAEALLTATAEGGHVNFLQLGSGFGKSCASARAEDS
jgi:hypothetical protein